MIINYPKSESLNLKSHPSINYAQVVESLVKTGSALLEARNLESWREMGSDKKKRKAITQLTRGLENAGLLLPEGARENQEVTITAKNIRESLILCKVGIKMSM